jgi:hypothetical protein
MGFAVTTYTGTTPVVGLVSASTNSQQELLDLSSSNTTLGTNQDRYNQWLKPCVALDNRVITDLTSINSSKTDIVSNGNSTIFEANPKYYSTSSAAINATTTLYNGTLSTVQAANNLNFIGINVKTATNFSVGAVVSSATGGTGTVSIQNTSQIGNPFNVIVQDVTGSFGVGATVYLAGIAFTTLGSLDYVGSGQLYNDNVIVTYYPDLEPANTSVDNPFADLQLKILNNSVKGLGVANTFYSNSLENGNTPDGNFVDSNDSINPIGRVYAFDTTSGSTQKSNIDNLIVSVTSGRSGITSYNNGSSTIKGYKKGASVNIWTLEKTDVDIQATINANNAVIGILKDPANGGPY